LDKGTKNTIKKRFKIYNTSIHTGKAHSGIDKGLFHDDAKKGKGKKRHVSSDK